MQKKRFYLFLTAALAALFLTIPAFAASKSAQISFGLKAGKASDKIKDSESEEYWSLRQGEMTVTPKKKRTKMTSNMTFSFRALIPASLFRSNGDAIRLNTYLYADSNGKTYSAVSRDFLLMERDKKGTVELSKVNINWQKSKPGKIASLEKKGKYYILTVSNLPVEKKWVDCDDDSNRIAIDTGKTFNVSIGVQYMVNFRKKTNVKILVDELSLKAKKKLAATFDKKDYSGITIQRYNNKTIKAKVVKNPR